MSFALGVGDVVCDLCGENVDRQQNAVEKWKYRNNEQAKRKWKLCQNIQTVICSWSMSISLFALQQMHLYPQMRRLLALMLAVAVITMQKQRKKCLSILSFLHYLYPFKFECANSNGREHTATKNHMKMIAWITPTMSFRFISYLLFHLTSTTTSCHSPFASAARFFSIFESLVCHVRACLCMSAVCTFFSSKYVYRWRIFGCVSFECNALDIFCCSVCNTFIVLSDILNFSWHKSKWSLQGWIWSVAENRGRKNANSQNHQVHQKHAACLFGRQIHAYISNWEREKEK